MAGVGFSVHAPVCVPLVAVSVTGAAVVNTGLTVYGKEVIYFIQRVEFNASKKENVCLLAKKIIWKTFLS